MREIKFRAWDKTGDLSRDCVKRMIYSTTHPSTLSDLIGGDDNSETNEYTLMQYTGLKDKNGVDIYELCELNNRYIVTYKSPKFVLYEITSGDIIEFNDQDEYEITTEYKPLPQDSKRGAN